MKNIKKLLVLTVATGLLFSCSDYLDINRSPNDPFANQVTPEFILPGAQVELHSVQARTMNRLGNVFMYNWGANVNSFTGGFAEEYKLEITSDFYSGIWDGLFIDLGKLQAIIDTDFENFENHIAIAKIMKSYYYQYLVDLYGNLPYTEAFGRQNNLTPAYDDAEFVYKELIAQLDSAQVLMSNVTSETALVGSEDVIYNGIMTEWSKFANTVKLKMLLRLSSKAEFDTYVTDQFASLQTADFVTEDVTINPGYAVDKPQPNWSLFIDPNGDPTQTFRFIRAGDYAVDFMDGSITGVVDPRLTSLYDPVGTDVVGVLQGADDSNAPEEISPLGDAYLKSADQDGIVMLAAVSYFMQAEAVLKGYMPGNAQALFEEGISASMAFHGIAGTDALTYIAATSAVPGLGWTGSNEEKLEAIMTQKWLATNGINAIESYIEMTRTGYPEIPLPLTAQRPQKPNRLLYPTSERFANSANVPAQTTDTAYDSYIFWDPQG